MFAALVEEPILTARGLLNIGQMSRADRELIILRVTGRTGAAHEWGTHVQHFGQKSGLSAEQNIAAVRPAIDSALWTPRQLAILALVDGILKDFDLPDESWEMIREHLGEQELVEMVMIAGLYLTISIMVRVFRIPEQPGAPKFPSGSADIRFPDV
jgi:hypothetical protein